MIRRLQADPVLEHFILVGETALSLQLGHRTSIDIDFFTRDPFDAQELLEHLEHTYRFQEQYRHTNTLKGIMNGIFVDLLRHDYHYFANHLHLEGITMASKQDIAAMKVNAIAGNGSRAKDFIDIYFLLKEFSFSEVIGFYTTRYNSRNDFHAIKSLTFFDDLIPEEWPVMLLEKELTLKKLQKKLVQERDLFLKNYHE